MLNVDLIGQNGQLQGEVASYAMSAGRLDPNSLRPFVGSDNKTYITVHTGGSKTDPQNYKAIPIMANGTLRRDEWKQLDDVILKAAEYRLGGVDDLVSAGLTYQLGNAMGTTVLEWHDISSALTADLTMDGVTRVQNNRPVYTHNYMPIPILHVDYEINARELATSRNMGNPIDTTMAERAVRTIKERLEAMLFTDTTYQFGEKDSRNQNAIYSYINHPDRNLVSLTIPWNDSSVTGKDIVDQIIGWKQVGIDALHYGPWQLYIPTAYETKLDEDYTGSNPDTNAAVTIRQRIMNISNIKGIKVIDTLEADNVLMVQMTSDVVRLVQGMGLTNVEWGTEGNFITKFKVLTIQVPQIRSDANRRSGIIHIS